jgi:hypothetical protein
MKTLEEGRPKMRMRVSGSSPGKSWLESARRIFSCPALPYLRP